MAFRRGGRGKRRGRGGRRGGKRRGRSFKKRSGTRPVRIGFRM